MSARNITVSTVGLVPRMQQLTDEGIPVTLALSLHAPDDELRNELVPINTRWSVHEAVEAAWDYARTTKRRVSIEYAMMKDINDQAWRADLLGDVLHSYGDWGWVHVNLIPLNPTPGSTWTASRPEDEREFVRRLVAKGIPTTVRDTRGQRHRRRLRPAGRRALDQARSRPAARRCGRRRHRSCPRSAPAGRSRTARGRARRGRRCRRGCRRRTPDPAWSTIVRKIDKVPSLVVDELDQMRACCGKSTWDAVLISQNPPGPGGRLVRDDLVLVGVAVDPRHDVRVLEQLGA